jgi:phospholipid/cholesterol/gamma-HCH transport system ATP-binding protein
VQDLDEATVRTRVQNVLREVALDPEKDINLTTDQLSGGMAKRVAIARALALDPIQVFYDEPTTGLDPQVSEKIQDLIGSVHRGKTASGAARTSFIITHDKEMLFRLQPRVVMLDAGRIVFDGTYEDFGRSDAPAIRPYFDRMPKLQQYAGGSASAASR